MHVCGVCKYCKLGSFRVYNNLHSIAINVSGFEKRARKMKFELAVPHKTTLQGLPVALCLASLASTVTNICGSKVQECTESDFEKKHFKRSLARGVPHSSWRTWYTSRMSRSRSAHGAGGQTNNGLAGRCRMSSALWCRCYRECISTVEEWTRHWWQSML